MTAFVRWFRSWSWWFVPSRHKAARFAKMNGYFWLPCPTCGRYFSGNEWLIADWSARVITSNAHQVCSIPTKGGGEGHGTGICPHCTKAGVGLRAWAAVNDKTVSPFFGAPQ
jgi:hypothetical protein